MLFQGFAAPVGFEKDFLAWLPGMRVQLRSECAFSWRLSGRVLMRNYYDRLTRCPASKVSLSKTHRCRCTKDVNKCCFSDPAWFQSLLQKEQFPFNKIFRLRSILISFLQVLLKSLWIKQECIPYSFFTILCDSYLLAYVALITQQFLGKAINNISSDRRTMGRRGRDRKLKTREWMINECGRRSCDWQSLC